MLRTFIHRATYRPLSKTYKATATTLLNFHRTMSTEYLVTVFDLPTADRSKVRAQHVKDIPANVPNPVRSAGAIYTDESKSKFAGSTFHLVADNKDEIIEFLKKDIYFKEGVWDIDNVQIYPLGVAIRLPKEMDGVDELHYKI